MKDSRCTIKIKFHSTGEEVSTDVETLQEWIRSGKVVKEDMVYGLILTGGEWKCAGDMRVFYAAHGLLPMTEDEEQSKSTGQPQPISECYVALRIVSSICKVLAVIVVIMTIINSIMIGIEASRAAKATSFLMGIPDSNGDPISSAFGPSISPGTTSFFAIVQLLLIGAIVAVLLWAVGEVIPLLIDMRNDSKRAAEVTN